MNKNVFYQITPNKFPEDLTNGAKHSNTILLVCITRKNANTSKLEFAE